MSIEFVSASVFHIDAYAAVFKLLFFAISRIVISAPGAFDQRTEYSWWNA